MIEKETIEQCRKGNLQDFRKIVEYSSPLAFSVALRMLGDEEDAMDIVQESMITIWKKIKRINSPASFKAWMYRIVLNKCYDELRKRKRNPEKVADESTWKILSERISENPGRQADNKETAMIIMALTEKLSPKQKAVFILADIEEMPGDEISRITGMTRINIKANLYYARKRIGEMIVNYL
ncbi:MAG: RNA polymerase sigma factor [Bacteroidales bacterium]